MAKVTSFEIARDFDLFGEYVDPDATVSREQFDAMSIEEREALIAQTFPGETLSEYPAELVVEVLIADSEDVLAGFPYAEGQYQDGCEDDESNEDVTWLIIVLGDASDTTTAQEQFLNASDKVLSYTIR